MYQNREEELESVIAQWDVHFSQTVGWHIKREHGILDNRDVVIDLLEQERAFNAGIVNLCLTGE